MCGKKFYIALNLLYGVLIDAGPNMIIELKTVVKIITTIEDLEISKAAKDIQCTSSNLQILPFFMTLRHTKYIVFFLLHIGGIEGKSI